MNNSTETENKYIKKGFDLINDIGWEEFSLEKLSTKEKIPINDLKVFFKCKNSIVDKFSRMIDKNIESKLRIDDFKDSSKKDILFELIMMRFDEMEGFKGSLVKILDVSKNKPLLISIITKNVMNTMDFFLELSNSYNNYAFDFLKKNFLFFIYSITFKTWLSDDTEDLSKTMAELDKLLSTAENFQQKVSSFLPI
ncbi:MAG: hypothetical protein CMM92_06105 [Rickettsiales bacterium]|nr:hypothetical protein [Rickettsiales bacterium]RPG13031.1 MAG: hypothetical protein CBD55_006070 [Pelagibacteraceae bacterium TMED195]|tara:strand:+ start:4420 stop:5007 length:588 start_codon:yes stop_codon:yes gene_type:complete